MTVSLLHPYHYLMQAAGFTGSERRWADADWFPYCIHCGDYNCDLCAPLDSPFAVR